MMYKHVQEPARALLEKVACHPLTITILAGAIRQRARRRGCAPSSPAIADVLATLLDDWETQVASFARKDLDEQYKQPLLAYKLSCEGLSNDERTLVDALRFFPPTVLTPAAALELVWHQRTPALEEQSSFADLLGELLDAHIIEHHSFRYHHVVSDFPGVHSPSTSFLERLVHIGERAHQGTHCMCAFE
jgi:hypothetical protein